MNCSKCGTVNEKDAAFCAECGAKLEQEAPQVQIPVPPVPPVPPVSPIPQPVNLRVPPMPKKQEVPGEYKPLGAWGYVGWQLLFALPFAGFVLLIVMSFAPRNKNLKSFARSYWCMALLVFAIALVAVLIIAAVGGGFGVLSQYLSQLQ